MKNSAAFCASVWFMAITALVGAMAESSGLKCPASPDGVNATRECQDWCLANRTLLFPDNMQCYELLTAGPCKRKEWLVLDERFEDDFVLRCASKRCKKRGEILWPKDSRCYRRIDEKKLCPHEGNMLEVNAYGEGECVCNITPPRARRVDAGPDAGPAGDPTCYPLYARGGPCPDDQLFVPAPANATTVEDHAGVCQPDPCLAGTPDPKPPPRVRVRLPATSSSGDGDACRELGSTAGGAGMASGVLPSVLCDDTHCQPVFFMPQAERGSLGRAQRRRQPLPKRN